VTDLYALLGVAPGASEDEIRSAYHRRLRFDDVETPEGNQRMRELREAYEVLSDPDRRRSYDASRDGWTQVVEQPVTAPEQEPVTPPEPEPEPIDQSPFEEPVPVGDDDTEGS